jgi:hypothetical protein
MLVHRRYPNNIFKDVIVCCVYDQLECSGCYNIKYCISVLPSANLINKNQSVILKGHMCLGRYDILWFQDKRNKYWTIKVINYYYTIRLVIDLNVWRFMFWFNAISLDIGIIFIIFYSLFYNIAAKTFYFILLLFH